MPKATSRPKPTARKDPLSKPPTKESTATNDKDDKTKPDEPNPSKDPKASHLYTDDNPSTTLHGTGFKDAATAHHTLSLIATRSLTYQFQTVNTLFHRARNHPSVKRTRSKTAEDKSESEGPAGILAAIDVFQTWLETTYPASKGALRAGGGFKPLLSKKCVERFLPGLEERGVGKEALEFARLYVSLPRNRRLGNVLVDEGEPGGKDWEVMRYEALDGLVEAGKEEGGSWEEGELWDGEGELSEVHARLVAWGWSPVGERRLERVKG
ncbi:hypothetical protein WHR41_09103 [Cladosporium halotolerans]|uniref:Uncharacterized protein n=1 Tax=Cladosporium halotolerans TaxID=1052096 RepID=A0AB34KEN7_9PEZI